MAVQGVHVKLSTSFHLQTDRQTKIMNRCLETYLRYMCVESCEAPTRHITTASHRTTALDTDAHQKCVRYRIGCRVLGRS